MTLMHVTHPERIGPFKILRVIGEGGMGIVYEAEQERPQRRVALKIVRPGLVPEGVLRRFEIEYEVLGRLQHPGIAQIYQAGVEDTIFGPQPYFAMELVDGLALDEYVRQKSPALRDRLLLVAAIADAVQHAHHRGVIHRDLKPANILVTAAGEPKVLDFGIARAHDGILTHAPTAAGEVLGTISYMSPEQISGDITVDTRSDVYALGVVLYETLAGRPPYNVEHKTLAEAARIIHDTEPTRLRSTHREIPADVETIVVKALEKEKERRYNSAADLAEDIRRFLRDEPIVARAPSAAYQVRKFARRHKGLVAAILAAFVVLLTGVVATSWQAVRASRAERAAQARAREAEIERTRAEAVTAFLTETLGSVDPSQARGREVTVREALDAAAAKIDGGAMANQPAVEIAVRNAIGTTYVGLGLLDPGERQLRAAHARGVATNAAPLVRAETATRLVNALYAAGKYEDAETFARESLTLRQSALGSNHVDVASSLDDLGAILMARRERVQAEPFLREAVTIKRRLLPAGDPKLAVSLNNLGYLLWTKTSYQEAETAYLEALAIDRRTLGADHPELATRLINLAVLYRDWGRPEETERLSREALAIRLKVLGDRHPEISDAKDTLATALELRGRHAEAETLLRDAVGIAREAFGEVNLNTARLEHNLAFLLWKQGKYAEALPLFRTAVVKIPQTYGPTYRGARLAIANLARNLNGLGDYRAAEPIAREALAAYRKAPTDQIVVSALAALGQSLVGQRRFGEAVPVLREAEAVVTKQPTVRFPWFKGEILSLLGAARAGEREADAEKLLLDGYNELHGSAATPPPLTRAAVERLVSFYSAAGRADEAAKWRGR